MKLTKACLEHDIFWGSLFAIQKNGKNFSKRRISLYNLSWCEFTAKREGIGKGDEKEKWERGQRGVQRYLKSLKQQSEISTSQNL